MMGSADDRDSRTFSDFADETDMPSALNIESLMHRKLDQYDRLLDDTSLCLNAFEEAMELFETRRGFDFTFLWCCTDDVTLLDLAHAAGALGRTEEASDLLERAQAAGSTEAADVEMP